MNRIRGTLDEMRDLRNRLRQHYGSGPRGEKELLGSGKGITELYGLTPRESEVALLLAHGRSNAAIAAELGISTHTARHHTQRVLAKLEVRSRAEAGALLRGLFLR